MGYLGEAVDDGVDFQELVLRTRAEDATLGPRRLWSIQKQIVRGLETANSISIKGCHASGKTDVISGATLGFLARRTMGKAIVLAPTQRQVKTFVAEVELKRQSAIGYSTRWPECSALGLEISKARYLQGMSSSRSVNIQGPHGRDLLIVVDEAPGVQPDMWDAIEGMRSGGNVKLVKLGNPVVPSGPFYEDFENPPEGHLNFTISAFDTPNLIGLTMQDILDMKDVDLDYCPRPYLIRRRWVREMYRKWGPESAKFLARVLGLFPHQSSWAVFLKKWIERAMRDPTAAELKAAEGHFIRVGIDVAGGGDDESVGYARVDGIILDMEAWPDEDPFAKMIYWLESLKQRFADRYPMGPIVVDVVGIGKHLAPRIAGLGYEVFGFQAGNTAMDHESFENAKTEIYWAARGHFEKNRISGLVDKDTRDQLAEILYEEPGNKRTRIEPKQKAKKFRNVDSPDRAEALIMALMQITPRSQVIEDNTPPYLISPY